MEVNNRFLVKMRIIINILVIISTILQFLVSVFNMLNMSKPETFEDSMYNCFVLVSCFCSFMVGFIFIMIFNFKYKPIENIIIKASFLIVALFALYVHLYQIFVQKDLILASCVLFLVDVHIGQKIIKW